jgi:signal transduction histidine kinase
VKFAPGKLVEIAISKDEGTASLAVRDHGIGISPQDQPRIFDRFERAVSAKHFAGLGLGLYISRGIVEAHGGSIGLESELGVGSTFTVRLPLEPEPPVP